MYTSSSSSTTSFSTFGSLISSPTRNSENTLTSKKQNMQDDWTEFLSSSVAALAKTTIENSSELDNERGNDDNQESSSSSSSIPHELTEQMYTAEKQGPRTWESAFDTPKVAASNKARSYSTDSFSMMSDLSEMSYWRPLGHRSSQHSHHDLNETLKRSTIIQPTISRHRKARARTASFRGAGTSISAKIASLELSENEKKSATGNGNTLESDNVGEKGAMYAAVSSSMVMSIDNPTDNHSYDSGLVESSSDEEECELTNQNEERNECKSAEHSPISASLYHVKSPVLGTDGDVQTWKLQDEELMAPQSFRTLPRRRIASTDNVVMSYGNGMDGPNNQLEQREQIGSTRKDRFKDLRASSVDLTCQDFQQRNAPPLPPSHDPIHRLRAKSFSFSVSQSYGQHECMNPSWSEFPKQYDTRMIVPPHEYMAPGNSGCGSSRVAPPVHPAPPQPSSTHPSHFHVSREREQLANEMSCLATDVAPPIPTHVAFHPPPPYPQYAADNFRRMSVPHMSYPPNRESVMVPTSNGTRDSSYGMHVISHPPKPDVRIFPPPPPMEPPIMIVNPSRPVYEWPRRMTDASPAATRASLMPLSSVSIPYPPPDAQYEVEFKRGRQETFAGNRNLNLGDYVKVEADRGEDIGQVVKQLRDPSGSYAIGGSEASNEKESLAIKRHGVFSKRILCLATQREIEMLLEQRREEREVYEVCKSKVRQRMLPMNVIDAEYQFDRHKLTFFFEAERRIDFRELVRDLFAIYKTRIWLQQVVTNGKKLVSPDLEVMN